MRRTKNNGASTVGASTRPATATTEKLLKAAEIEFGRNGFEGSRLEDIAAEAGIRRPSLLYHFRTKEELYQAVVHRSFSEFGKVIRTTIGTQGVFSRKLDLLVTNYLQFLDERPEIGRIILRELLNEKGIGYHIILKELLPLLRSVERFVIREGGALVPSELPVRQAILQTVVSGMVRGAVGPAGAVLWGGKDKLLKLARHTFLPRENSRSTKEENYHGTPGSH